MKDLNTILDNYPNLKAIIDRDKPKMYDGYTNTRYTNDAKLSPNLGLIYDFGGTEGPVEGNNIVIVDYDPRGSSKPDKYKEKYDKDINIYKFNQKMDKKNNDVIFPDTMEVNGKLRIAYANILNFPKTLKVRDLNIAWCTMKDYLFDSKLSIDGNLNLVEDRHNGTDILQNLVTPEINDFNKLADVVRGLIENKGGYVKGDITLNNVKFQK